MKTLIKQHFLLYANCVLVRGASRATICDLQRGIIHLIPLDMLDFLIKTKGLSVDGAILKYGENNVETIMEYYNFLIDEELGFYCQEDYIFNYPDIDFTYDTPYIITNAIIDIDKENHDFNILLDQFEILGCLSLQIRFFSVKPLSYLLDILENINLRRIKSVEIILKYDDCFSQSVIEYLCKTYLYITSITIHSYPDKKDIYENNILSRIDFTSQVISGEQHCGFINVSDFAVNLTSYSEAKKFNSCLNRKVSIDSHGNLKNCPAMIHSYGHHKEVNIVDLVKTKEFQEIWHLNKNQVSVCQDCEFRYICTDCRAILTDKEDLYSKPLRCSYDPYTATWNK